jgi:hypothetical protein
VQFLLLPLFFILSNIELATSDCFYRLLRSLTLAIGWLAFFAAFFPVHFLLKGQAKLRSKIEVRSFISEYVGVHIIFSSIFIYLSLYSVHAQVCLSLCTSNRKRRG